MTAVAVVERQCSECLKHKPMTSDYFYRRSDRPGGFDYACKGCESDREKKRLREMRAEHEPGKPCGVCYDQSWRRPKNRKCKCGEYFAEEPPVTVDEILAMPRPSQRSFPAPVEESVDACKRGHVFDQWNTGRNTKGGRVCLECRDMRAAGEI